MSTQLIPIIDSHHHIWLLKNIPWLQGPILPRIFGDYSSMKCDYSGEDYLRDLNSNGVRKSVYVQANWDNDKGLEEVQWVQSVADSCAFPHAIVGYADVSAKGLPRLLDDQMKCRNFRGIRQQLHWHPNPQYKFASTPDLMKSKEWLKGFKEIESRGLTFDLQIFSNQMSDGFDLVQEFPKTNFILTHAGMLESNRPEDIDNWRNGMQKLAKCPNLFVKLSGLGTFVHKCETQVWEPIVDEMIALFGAERCMFGTNFPVEKLWTTYSQMVSTIRQCLSKYPLSIQNAVLHENASRIYKI
ncbi:MAG: amidohydrolase family protein [Betaproteobacteria bacterium]|jgi:predicted TIM-barrel fold metal-dependent hydrolase